MVFDHLPLTEAQMLAHLQDCLGLAGYLGLLREALAQLSDTASTLQEPLGQDDLESLAHHIKGSPGSFGLTRLAFMAGQIENRCRLKGAHPEDRLLLLGVVLDSRRALETELNALASMAS